MTFRRLTSSGLIPVSWQRETTSGLVKADLTAASASFGAAGLNTLALVLASQQTAHAEQAYGVPADYNWCYGPLCQFASPPVGWTAMTMWGQIYFAGSGFSSDSNTRVQIRNSEAYCWSISEQKWFVMQQLSDYADYSMAFYVADFYNNDNISAASAVRDETDNEGGFSVLMTRATTTTPNGTEPYLLHYFNSGNRATYPVAATDIGGVFTTSQARLILDNPDGTDDRASADYVTNVGGDWWESPTSGTNQGINQGQFLRVPADGSWIALNSWSGPVGFQGTWTGAPSTPIDGTSSTPAASAAADLTVAVMTANPPPLNALGS
jgi:hypothetical protein